MIADLIGDKDLGLKRELNSTDWLLAFFERRALELGYENLFSGSASRVDDDHIPFLQRGVPAVDLIDFDYGPDNEHWHTSDDNLKNVSAESIAIIGDLLLESIDPLCEELKKRGR